VKLTPWFRGSVRPAREGVYEVEEQDRSRWYCYFDGLSWYFGGHCMEEAQYGYDFQCEMTRTSEAECVNRWRGVVGPT
jgi:hypothetical protein